MSFRRALRYLVIGSLVSGAPVLIASTIWGWEIFGVGLYGVFGALAAVGNRRRPGLAASGFLAVTGGLAVALAWTPLLGALLMAAVGLVMGIAARWHLHGVFALIGIAVGFLLVEPPPLPWFPTPTGFDPGYALAVTGILAASGLWATLATGYLTRGITLPKREPIAARTVRYFAIAVVLALAVGTYIVLRWYPGGTGGWLIMTILIILQPDWTALRSKATERTIGTLLGVAVAAGLVLVIPPSLHGVVGVPLVLIALAYRQGGVYWRYTTIMTPGVVLMITQGKDQTEALTTDAQRLGFTLGAMAIIVAVSLILGGVARASGSMTRTP